MSGRADGKMRRAERGRGSSSTRWPRRCPRVEAGTDRFPPPRTPTHAEPRWQRGGRWLRATVRCILGRVVCGRRGRERTGDGRASAFRAVPWHWGYGIDGALSWGGRARRTAAMAR